jgi:hypothetical protein
MQHELKKAHNQVQDRVNLKYYTWFLSKYGFYILRHSPRIFFTVSEDYVKVIL